MRAFRRWTWVVALAWVSTAAAAGEDRNIYLAQARVFYQGLEFEKCLQRLEQASRLSSNSSREELADIELYNGLCRFNLGQRDEAASNFKLALQLNPSITLPPATSPRIAQVFDAIAAKMPKPEPEVAKDAPKELALQPSNAEQRPDLVATQSPQQGGSKVLPLTLAGTSVAAAVVGAVFGKMAQGDEAQANDPRTYYAEAQKAGKDAQSEATTSTVLFVGAGAAAVGAVITWLTAD